MQWSEMKKKKGNYLSVLLGQLKHVSLVALKFSPIKFRSLRFQNCWQFIKHISTYKRLRELFFAQQHIVV